MESSKCPRRHGGRAQLKVILTNTIFRCSLSEFGTFMSLNLLSNGVQNLCVPAPPSYYPTKTVASQFGRADWPEKPQDLFVVFHVYWGYRLVQFQQRYWDQDSVSNSWAACMLPIELSFLHSVKVFIESNYQIFFNCNFVNKLRKSIWAFGI